jgi:hypothetical protein
MEIRFDAFVPIIHEPEGEGHLPRLADHAGGLSDLD